MAETVEPLESFKDCWTTFRRQVLGMMDGPCTPEEAQELLKSRDALLLRLRRLRKADEGQALPAAIGLLLEQLKDYGSFESLSDAKSARLNELVRDGESRILAWYAGIERKSVYQVSVARKESRERIWRIFAGVGLFVGFSALMSAAAIQIFLNRSIR